MKLQVFCVYDSKVEAYLQPFFMRTHGEAERAFADLANKTDHTFNNHPGDYTLFRIGEFEEETGRFTSEAAFVNLGTALEHIRQQPGPGQLDLVNDG